MPKRKNLSTSSILYSMLTVADIQEHLQISRKKAYAVMKLPDFPTIQIGKRSYISEKDYAAWLDKYKGSKVSL